jgi:hypothetical protein
MVLSLNVFAHDEGHGPKLKDVGRRGGRVTAVVLAKDASKGTAAEMFYKSEIVRTKNGVVKIYFYDKNMNPLKPETFAKTAKATLISRKRGKFETKDFDLTFVTDHYEGTTPKPIPRRYSIDVKVIEGDKELLAAFDNLD